MPAAPPHRERDTNPGRVNDSGEYRRPGIAGSGAIGCGLAACVTAIGDVRLLARSDASAWRAEERAQADCAKVEGGSPKRIRVTTDPADLATATWWSRR